MQRLADTPEYRTWRSMLNRCTNPRAPNWKYYGGRGIEVCERWRSFVNFVIDMGRRPTLAHSIDRWPNKDGNYEPGNCRWATGPQQAKNKRPVARRRIVNAELVEWAREYRQRHGRAPKVREALDAFSGVPRTTMWRKLRAATHESAPRLAP